jgi:hypothetical protein
VIHIETKRCVGGGLRRWLAWYTNDAGYAWAAFGLTEAHARRRLLASLDARDAAWVVAR